MHNNYDASDGLAAAVCHFYEKASPLSNTGSKNWEDYIKKNPDRIK
jgi:crossover junction endodeoxyribonuclease RuvC